ncbi:dihydrofolate reductase family protein [Actinomycetospora endophytica]|uniref:Riboflavin biosynthesis protein RibD n=1 Tax=Actinomycetospora endophytica TaxID=2291215 RepID=A0ABS8PFV5_9PSEU|nr:dihydrofolate reductase family protein [Actinomycetospora endophytica]MCD2197151.1 dihydrofolate reductase family protein [Actinomycetospora endophytica]
MRPHVLASCAVSLDGFLDDASDERLILSGPADLDRVDGERAGVDAILVGAGTVRADDPRLLVRSAERRDVRVSWRRTPSPLRVVLSGKPLDPAARVLTEPGAETVVLDGSPGEVLDDLAGRGVVRLMIEGGAGVLREFLTAGAVDELQLVVAPVLVGAGPRFTGAPGVRAALVETRSVGDDVLLRHRFGPPDDRHLAEACVLTERCPPSESAFSVGCLVVAADGAVLGSGWSRRDDPLDHAEEGVLRELAGDPRLPGATLYSSLEPCGQRASRPDSCATLIERAGIGRVVYAWREPPEFVARPSGIAALERAGITTTHLPRWEPLARRSARWPSAM